MYTPRDKGDMQLAHDHLMVAAELINGVLERNRIDTPMQLIAFLAGAKHDADLADQELGMAGKYMGWADGKATA